MGDPLSPPAISHPPPEPPRSNLPMLYYGLVVIATAVVVLVLYNLVVIKWCTDFASHRTRRRRTDGPASFRSSGVSLVSSFKFKSEGGGDSECVVCLSVFEEGEEVKKLPKCKHCFHAACIDMWLYSHLDCPLCRSSVEPDAVVGEAAMGHQQHVTRCSRSILVKHCWVLPFLFRNKNIIR